MKSNLLARAFFWAVVGYAYMRVAQVFWLRKEIPFLIFILILVGAVYVFCYIRATLINGKFRMSFHMKLTATFFVLCLLSVIVQYIFQPDVIDSLGVHSLGFVRYTLAVGVIWFLAGAAVQRAKIQVSNIRALLIVSSLIFMVASNLGSHMVLNYRDLSEGSGYDELNHLLVAEFILYVCLFAYVSSCGYVRFMIFFATLFLLFASGGRSSFVFGMLSIGLFEWIYGRRRTVMGYVLVLTFAGISVGHFIDTTDSGVQTMIFMEGVIADGSAQIRLSQFSAAIEALPSQIPFGDPGFIARAFGSMGNYAHSVLSAWQFFGLLPFALLLFLLTSSIRIMRSTVPKNPDVTTSFGCVALIYTVLSIIFSKHVGFYLLWFSLGFWAARPLNIRRLRKLMRPKAIDSLVAVPA